jgi:NAD(P)-dependent dehydrogenase (short-subunit alcohol dehydrogenase family)
MDFADKKGAAVVTGGTGGIGATIVDMFLERGSAVSFTYHRNTAAADAKVAEQTAAERRVSAARVDLTDEERVAAYFHRVVEEFGAIHTLVYASGPHVPMVHLSKVSPAQYARQLNDDALAFFTLAVTALPHLRETQGNIVAVTTAATRRFPVRDGLSSAPKGAVEATVRGIAAEEGRFGIRANTVGPGMLTDGMADRLIGTGELSDEALAITQRNIPLRRFGRAADIAEAVCFLASDRANFISGQHLDVDGGYGV